MNIYYEKKSKKVKVLGFFSILFLMLSVVSGALLLAYTFKFITDFKEYIGYLQIFLVVSVVLMLLFFIFKKVANKRKNIRFDGRIIKLCVNNHIEHEFDLRRVDEIFNYRDDMTITYGLQDALAFRFHKNEIWETITSNLYNKKTKADSLELIKDINVAYALIKSQRALKEINAKQGVRFRYLKVKDVENASIDEKNEALRKLESSFENYSNTYGGMDVERLVITTKGLFYNKEEVVNKEDNYIKVRDVLEGVNEKYIKSQFIDFYDRENNLLLSIDLTLVINSELFKTLALAVFDMYQEAEDLEKVSSEN